MSFYSWTKDEREKALAALGRYSKADLAAMVLEGAYTDAERFLQGLPARHARVMEYQAHARTMELHEQESLLYRELIHQSNAWHTMPEGAAKESAWRKLCKQRAALDRLIGQRQAAADEADTWSKKAEAAEKKARRSTDV